MKKFTVVTQQAEIKEIKVKAFYFSNSLLTMLQSYLLNWQLYVSYDGYISKFNIAASGVPQGSNLGPLLFILFVNDLLL